MFKKKIFTILFCLTIFVICFYTYTKIHTNNKNNLISDEALETAERDLIYKIALETFGDIKNENELGLKEIYLNCFSEKKDANYDSELKNFIKNHPIYEADSLINSEKKIVNLYEDLIVKNIYYEFYNNYMFFLDDDEINNFNSIFKKYFFETKNNRILDKYVNEFLLIKNEKEKKYNDNENYEKYAERFNNEKKHKYNDYINEICIQGYNKSLINIYFIINFENIISKNDLYKINFFSIKYNNENKNHIFNLLSSFLENNDIKFINEALHCDEHAINSRYLKHLKNFKGNQTKWFFKNKNYKKYTFPMNGSALGEVVKEYENYYNIDDNGFSIPKKTIEIGSKKNMDIYFAMKESRSFKKSFLKTKWTTKSSNNKLCENLNEFGFFDVSPNDMTKFYFLKNENLPKNNIIFDDGECFYIISLANVITKNNAVNYDGCFENIILNEKINDSKNNIKLNCKIAVTDSLIEDNEEEMKNEAFSYFIKKYIKNGKIKLINNRFKKFLKQKYNI